jgi:Tol biopolymer transport system component
MLVFARTLDGSSFKLFVVRLASDLQPEGQPEAVTDQTYSRINGIAWAGDRDVVFACYPNVVGELFRVPVAGGASPRRLDWAPRAVWPAIAHSQHRLAYGQSHPNENLWRMDLSTGQCRLLVGSIYRQYTPQFSPDGRRIAFTRSGPHAVWTCDADGGNCEERASFFGSLGGTPRWSPDGRWLAFDSREEGKAQIYVTPAGGGDRRRMTSGNAENRIPSWSRDGRWIYFESDRSGQWRVWKVPSGGGEPVQVTHARGGAAFESADGKYLYFAPSLPDAPLFRMPVEGGEELQVAPHLVSWDGFAVTPKGVYLLSDERTIQLLDEKTGLIRTVAKLEKNTAYSGLAVSADGGFVVFNQMEYRADLMLVEGFR